MIRSGPLAPKSKQQDGCKEFFRLLKRKASSLCAYMSDLCLCVYMPRGLSQLSTPLSLISASSSVSNNQTFGKRRLNKT